MTCILELNDADLTLYRNERVLYSAPGVALVLDREVRFGDDALRLSRVHPRQTNQQYLTRLNADPLPAPGGRARNHADLVYLHLQELKPLIDAEGGAVLLAVPGILSPDQLGVLLGVIQETGIAVRGFVDAAVAAVATREAPAQTYHLDVMLQRAVITALEVNHEVRKSAAQEVAECGLNRLLEGWINVIADRFVRETRFDPLHAAATEQQLFNQVYDWVNAGAERPELVVEIVHGDHTRRVELNRSALEDKAEQRFRQLADALPRGARVFLSARSARLPGLHRTLRALDIEPLALPADALPRGCLDNLPHIVPEDAELRLVTRLPHRGTVIPSAAAVPERPAATHALRGAEALPLGSPALALPVERDGEAFLLRSADALVNGARPTAPRALHPGDRVTLGEEEYLIIAVAD